MGLWSDELTPRMKGAADRSQASSRYQQILEVSIDAPGPDVYSVVFILKIFATFGNIITEIVAENVDRNWRNMLGVPGEKAKSSYYGRGRF